MADVGVRSRLTAAEAHAVDLQVLQHADEELRELAAKILSWSRETYVYFDNDFSGYAVKNAMTLQGMLAMLHAALAITGHRV